MSRLIGEFMEKVTHLVLITDTSRKGTQVVQTIRKVADELVMYEQAGVIINRVPDESIVPVYGFGRFAGTVRNTIGFIAGRVRSERGKCILPVR